MYSETDSAEERPYPRVNEVVPTSSRPFLSVEVAPAERDDRIIRRYVKIYAEDIDRVVGQLMELKDILKEKDRAFTAGRKSLKSSYRNYASRPRRNCSSEQPSLTHKPFQEKLSAVRVELQDDPK